MFIEEARDLLASAQARMTDGGVKVGTVRTRAFLFVLDTPVMLRDSEGEVRFNENEERFSEECKIRDRNGSTRTSFEIQTFRHVNVGRILGSTDPYWHLVTNTEVYRAGFLTQFIEALDRVGERDVKVVKGSRLTGIGVFTAVDNCDAAIGTLKRLDPRDGSPEYEKQLRGSGTLFLDKDGNVLSVTAKTGAHATSGGCETSSIEMYANVEFDNYGDEVSLTPIEADEVASFDGMTFTPGPTFDDKLQEEQVRNFIPENGLALSSLEWVM